LVDSEDLSDGGRAVVLSHASWQQRFGGRKEIVGTSVVLGDTPLDVVGVLPRGLIFPSPMVGDPEIVSVTAPPEPGDGVLNPIVRLESGATLEAAQAEIDTLAIQISPDQVPVLTEVRDILYRAPTPAMRFLMGASVLVMLVGCAHLTNLLMTRSHQRTWETGVRAALGASRARLVRPLVFEALLLGAAGAIVAVLVTVVSYDVLFPLVPPNAYGNAPVGVGVRVIVFAMALSLLGGLVFTVAPAWRSAALDVLTIIRKQQQADAIGSGTFGRPMLAVQVGLAIVLVTGSVIAGRTLLGVLNVPLGFEPENVITAHVPPPPDLLQGLDRQAFYTRAMESLEGLSDVVSVGAALTLPFDGAAQWRGVVGPDGQPLPAGTDHVLPGYFETAGIRTVRGRLFDWDDVRAGASVAVASEEFASIVFGDRDPIGESFEDNGGRRFTVIGMVDDAIRTLSDDSFFQPRAYVIPGQETRQMSLVIRTNARSEVLLRDVQRQLIDLAPGAALRLDRFACSLSESEVPSRRSGYLRRACAGFDWLGRSRCGDVSRRSSQA
jgi:predicted permease